jgi:uncharacterized membrane protein
LSERTFSASFKVKDSSRGSEMGQYHSGSKVHYDMEKIVAILCYFTPVGWLIAMVMYGDNKSPLASFHLRQSLGLIITAALLLFIPLVGWLLSLGVFVAWFFALNCAINRHQHPLPILGEFYQKHLDFIS